MEKYYRFAALELMVSIPDEIAYENEQLLTPFKVDTVSEPHKFTFDLAEEFPEPEIPLISRQPSYMVYGEGDTQIRTIGAEQEPHLWVKHEGKNHHVLMRKSSYPNGATAKTVLNSLALEHLIVEKNGFVFHCSYIEHEGKAILFTAPSGTGKSTQADLWHDLREAKIINGDKAVVRVEQGKILACGIPFAGSSEYCENKTLPIEAIVYLTQAPSNSIRKLRGYEAFSKIWEGVSVNTWDKDDMDTVSTTVKNVVETTAIYHLACTPDEGAVMALEEVLRK